MKAKNLIRFIEADPFYYGEHIAMHSLLRSYGWSEDQVRVHNLVWTHPDFPEHHIVINGVTGEWVHAKEVLGQSTESARGKNIGDLRRHLDMLRKK